MAGQDHVEIYRRKDGKYDWRRQAANGDITSTSGGQGYETSTAARRSAQDQHPGIPTNFVVKTDE